MAFIQTHHVRHSIESPLTLYIYRFFVIKLSARQIDSHSQCCTIPESTNYNQSVWNYKPINWKPDPRENDWFKSLNSQIPQIWFIEIKSTCHFFFAFAGHRCIAFVICNHNACDTPHFGCSFQRSNQQKCNYYIINEFCGWQVWSKS